MDDFLESEEFYNAMQAYRHAPLDGQERVIECFEKVKSMVRAELAQQAMVIEQMREAMLEHGKPHLHNEIEWDEALKLHPCPEVLNKVRADAVRKAFKLMMDGRWRGDALDVLADRMERGEA